MSNSTQSSKVLVASCPDTAGIVRAVSEFVYQLGAGIIQSHQFGDAESGRFFLRCEFGDFSKALPSLSQLEEQFAEVANQFDMQWRVYDASVKPRLLVAVSKYGHCLNDLLYRWEDGVLPAEIVGVVSNHPDLQARVEHYGLPYYHLPVTKENKAEQEQAMLGLMSEMKVDLLVLARYMQILSADTCQQLKGRAINIHHSFLPSFKGARPYHQAHQRGVKIIGATAHYVTDDLDEGPIIEQDIHRVSHSVSSAEMVHLGQEIESRVLMRAVKWHCEHKVLLNDNRTVVFNG